MITPVVASRGVAPIDRRCKLTDLAGRPGSENEATCPLNGWPSTGAILLPGGYGDAADGMTVELAVAGARGCRLP